MNVMTEERWWRSTCVQADKSWRLKKKLCETEQCAHLPVFEGENCVNECVSESCFQRVYGEEPVRVTRLHVGNGRVKSSCLRVMGCVVWCGAAWCGVVWCSWSRVRSTTCVKKSFRGV